MKEEDVRETAALVEQGGGRAVALRADAADEEDWRRTVSLAEEAFGGLDVLVNNAGGHMPPNFPEARERSDGTGVLDVNLRGVMLGIQAALDRCGVEAVGRSSTSPRSPDSCASRIRRPSTLQRRQV